LVAVADSRMTRQQALKLALEIMKGEHQNLRDVTFSANCYLMMGSRTYHAVRDHITYQEIVEAMQIIEGFLTDEKRRPKP
jgi:hypothetical protein